MFGNEEKKTIAKKREVMFNYFSFFVCLLFFFFFAYLTPNIAFVIRAIDYLVSRVLMVCAKALSKYFTYIISFNSFTGR